MGTNNSKELNIRYWNKPIILKFDKVFIDDIDLIYNRYYNEVVTIEEGREFFSQQILRFILMTGSIVLLKPSIKNSIYGMYLLIATFYHDREDIFNKIIFDYADFDRWIIISEKDIKPQVKEVVEEVNCFLSIIKEKYSELDIFLNKIIKIKEVFDKIDITQYDMHFHYKKERLLEMTNSIKNNNEKINHLLFAFQFFIKYFENFEFKAKKALEKIKNKSFVNYLFQSGKSAFKYQLINSTQIVFEYSKSKKITFFQNYFEIVEENRGFGIYNQGKLSPFSPKFKKKSPIKQMNNNNFNLELVTKQSEELVSIEDIRKIQKELSKFIVI